MRKAVLWLALLMILLPAFALAFTPCTGAECVHGYLRLNMTVTDHEGNPVADAIVYYDRGDEPNYALHCIAITDAQGKAGLYLPAGLPYVIRAQGDVKAGDGNTYRFTGSVPFGANDPREKTIALDTAPYRLKFDQRETSTPLPAETTFYYHAGAQVTAPLMDVQPPNDTLYFAGWTGNGHEYEPGQPIPAAEFEDWKELTLRPKWEDARSSDYYYLLYHSSDAMPGSLPFFRTWYKTSVNELVTAELEAHHHSSYDFDYWEASNGKTYRPRDVIYPSGTPADERKTMHFVARWKIASPAVITYDLNGAPGDPPASQSVGVECPLILHDTVPTWAGHTFLYWKLKDGNAIFYPNQLLPEARSKNLVAVWETVSISAADGGVWQKGSQKDLRMTVEADPTRFDALLVQGVQPDGHDYYVAAKDAQHLLVALRYPYLETLPVGRHSFELTFTDGSVRTVSFTILAQELASSAPPQTGDTTPVVWLAALMVMAAGGIIVISRRRKA